MKMLRGLWAYFRGRGEGTRQSSNVHARAQVTPPKKLAERVTFSSIVARGRSSRHSPLPPSPQTPAPLALHPPQTSSLYSGSDLHRAGPEPLQCVPLKPLSDVSGCATRPAASSGRPCVSFQCPELRVLPSFLFCAPVGPYKAASIPPPVSSFDPRSVFSTGHRRQAIGIITKPS